MDRSRNPYSIEQRGSRLRLVSLITGLTIDVDIRDRQLRKTAANLMAAHNKALCEMQDAVGLPINATTETRKSVYDQWHYIHTEPQTVFI